MPSRLSTKIRPVGAPDDAMHDTESRDSRSLLQQGFVVKNGTDPALPGLLIGGYPAPSSCASDADDYSVVVLLVETLMSFFFGRPGNERRGASHQKVKQTCRNCGDCRSPSAYRMLQDEECRHGNILQF